MSLQHQHKQRTDKARRRARTQKVSRMPSPQPMPTLNATILPQPQPQPPTRTHQRSVEGLLLRLLSPMPHPHHYHASVLPMEQQRPHHRSRRSRDRRTSSSSHHRGDLHQTAMAVQATEAEFNIAPSRQNHLQGTPTDPEPPRVDPCRLVRRMHIAATTTTTRGTLEGQVDQQITQQHRAEVEGIRGRVQMIEPLTMGGIMTIDGCLGQVLHCQDGRVGRRNMPIK